MLLYFVTKFPDRGNDVDPRHIPWIWCGMRVESVECPKCGSTGYGDTFHTLSTLVPRLFQTVPHPSTLLPRSFRGCSTPSSLHPMLDASQETSVNGPQPYSTPDPRWIHARSTQYQNSSSSLHQIHMQSTLVLNQFHAISILFGSIGILPQ